MVKSHFSIDFSTILVLVIIFAILCFDFPIVFQRLHYYEFDCSRCLSYLVI